MPVIFIINNDGYKIHVKTALYKGVKINNAITSSELKKVLNEINDTPNKMHFIEVHMDANDAPEKLNKVAQAFSNQNS
ncbi:hypothetical protein [Staphylococcus equorum]|uniref:hypothetical protein n=1 Tax=Staphylococcus equorum TaxID=246432 RepID=UPI00298217A9|nr:hypothetical protein [Staphylococcus equorum]MDW5472674.1 hypothetical protein [Staphylococcus equorum]